MLTIESIIANHKAKLSNNPLVAAEDRLGRRLCDFLTEEQMNEIGFACKDEFKGKHTPVPFTEENVLKQLKEDVRFGYEKACRHRGISAGLMFDVVRDWCKILENGLGDWSDDNYANYGYPLFKAVDEKYGWGIVDDDPGTDDDYEA